VEWIVPPTEVPNAEHGFQQGLLISKLLKINILESYQRDVGKPVSNSQKQSTHHSNVLDLWMTPKYNRLSPQLYTHFWLGTEGVLTDVHNLPSNPQVLYTSTVESTLC
jgi:hypothetical protein